MIAQMIAAPSSGEGGSGTRGDPLKTRINSVWGGFAGLYPVMRRRRVVIQKLGVLFYGIKKGRIKRVRWGGRRVAGWLGGLAEDRERGGSHSRRLVRVAIKPKKKKLKSQGNKGSGDSPFYLTHAKGGRTKRDLFQEGRSP